MAQDEPRKGGKVTINVHADAPNLDPLASTEFATHYRLGLSYNRLVDWKTGPDVGYGEFIPKPSLSFFFNDTATTEIYTGVDERLEVPRILPPAPDFVDVTDARILIVDDVADTGHTLRSVQEFCAGKVAEVRTGVLYEKSHSVVKCDYVWKRTDLWINFPWSDKDPVAKRDWSVKDA